MAELVLRQNCLFPEEGNPALFFGPLAANLSTLFDMGYSLLCISWKQSASYKCTEKLHLIKGREKYLVGRVPRDALQDISAGRLRLSFFVKNGKQLMGCRSVDDRPPLDQLLLLYPQRQRKPPIKMVGNRSLRELVKDLP